MQALSGTFGLRNLAREIVSAFQASQMVVLQFPTSSDYAEWVPAVLRACDNELQSIGCGTLQSFDASAPGSLPSSLFEECFLDADCSIESFIFESGLDPTHIAFPEISNSAGMIDQWAGFLSAAVKCLKSLKSESESRYLLVTLNDPAELSQIEGPSCKIYRLWNPVSWEELRLVASSMIGPASPEISRYWKIATYTGACCMSPRLLELLCGEQPATLNRTLEVVLQNARPSEVTFRDDHNGSFPVFWRPWSVPEACVRTWARGWQIGATLDRGLSGPPEGATYEERLVALERRIWREHVAGLFPMIAEFSARSMRLLDLWLGTNWRLALGQFAGVPKEETYYSEPSIVLEFLRGEPGLKSKLPRSLIELLDALRKARNKIAHLRPLDLRELTKVWELFRGCEQISNSANR